MILEWLLSFVAPAVCLGCGEEGRWLCQSCGLNCLSPIESRCFVCKRDSTEYRTCSDCILKSALYSVFPATGYKGLIKNCIWQLKFGGARSIAPTLARLVPALGVPNPVIIPVPTASSRRRQRGYDQAILLAKALAAQRNLPYCAPLRRSGHSEQLGASRQQRLAQLQAAYHCTNASDIRGRHVVLVDDVMTTGATLESAARVLLAAGASRVSAVIVAQA